MDVELNSHIGAYHIDSKTGQWSIIGASDDMNEALNNRMYDTVLLDRNMKDAVCLSVKNIPITGENYEDFRKLTGTMPKHCYGTSYGWQQDEKIKQKLKDYYLNQSRSKEELKDFLKDCCKDMRVVLAQERKTTGMDINHNRQIILDTYERFRMANSVMANYACVEEGKTLACEYGWTQRDDIDWVYYNANYYYESEELRAIFKEAAEEIAIEWGCGTIDTSERDTDTLASYSSCFNQVWNNGSEYGARICHMIDISAKPPEEFYLFFRVSREENAHIGSLQVGIGETTKIREKIVFDIFGEYDQRPQFYHLSELLQNDDDVEHELEEYLHNFDIYTRYYGTILMRK